MHRTGISLRERPSRDAENNIPEGFEDKWQSTYLGPTTVAPECWQKGGLANVSKLGRNEGHQACSSSSSKQQHPASPANQLIPPIS